jgi:hypothetical protein
MRCGAYGHQAALLCASPPRRLGPRTHARTAAAPLGGRRLPPAAVLHRAETVWPGCEAASRSERATHAALRWRCGDGPGPAEARGRTECRTHTPGALLWTAVTRWPRPAAWHCAVRCSRTGARQHSLQNPGPCEACLPARGSAARARQLRPAGVPARRQSRSPRGSSGASARRGGAAAAQGAGAGGQPPARPPPPALCPGASADRGARRRTAAAAAGAGGGGGQGGAGALAELLRTIQAGMAAGPPPAPVGARLDVRGLTYHPAGAPLGRGSKLPDGAAASGPRAGAPHGSVKGGAVVLVAHPDPGRRVETTEDALIVPGNCQRALPACTRHRG